jgi:hypothetical protein
MKGTVSYIQINVTSRTTPTKAASSLHVMFITSHLLHLPKLSKVDQATVAAKSPPKFPSPFPKPQIQAFAI